MKQQTSIVLAFGLLVLAACAHGADEPTGAPEKIKPDAKVTISIYGTGHADEVVLPAALAKIFIEQLNKPSYKTHISKMPAAPMGEFKVEGKTYLWHGNAVITGDGDEERLWSGALTQRMIHDGGKLFKANTEELKKYLENLAAEPDIAKIKIEGPGAYPGGGDALHPIHLPPSVQAELDNDKANQKPVEPKPEPNQK